MWKEKKSPPSLERRFEFDEYQKTSLFMERIESLCKEKDIFPNISFGRNFVSITIFMDLNINKERFSEFARLVDKNFQDV